MTSVVIASPARLEMASQPFIDIVEEVNQIDWDIEVRTSMGTAKTDEKVFDLVMELMVHVKARTTEIAEEYGLSLPQMHALQFLDADSSAPMRELATNMHCDPSNITGITDRLETLGLAERKACSTDRRVKRIVLTEKGVALRTEILDRVSSSIAPVANLTAEQQRQFCELLQSALHDDN